MNECLQCIPRGWKCISNLPGKNVAFNEGKTHYDEEPIERCLLLRAQALVGMARARAQFQKVSTLPRTPYNGA